MTQCCIMLPEIKIMKGVFYEYLGKTNQSNAGNHRVWCLVGTA